MSAAADETDAEVPGGDRPQASGRLMASLALALCAVALAFGMAELAYRLLLSSKAPKLDYLRRPVLYADGYSDDEYWLLLHRWGKASRASKNPHPLLGWVAGVRSHEDLRHVRFDRLQGRRPILLYGDSFAQGVAGVELFQDILNGDPELSTGHFLLNYGVGGYGLDQIHLLMQETVPLYQDPIVIFSFLTYDMDRTIRRVSSSQKPYFELADGRLELRGTPIEPDQEAWFERQGTGVRSYLWRRLIHMRRTPLFAPTAFLRGEGEKRRRKIALSEAILDRTADLLRESDVDFEFLVFHPKEAFLRPAADWRERFLGDYFASRGLAPLDTREILRSAVQERPLEELFIPRDHHPTTLGNRIVADAIKERVLAAGSPGEDSQGAAEESDDSEAEGAGEG